MKKCICLLLSALLLLTMMPLMAGADPVQSEYYTDVYLSDPYYDAAMYLYQQSVMSGTAPNTFSPNADVTRAQIVMMLWCMAGKPAPDGTTMNFNDCPTGAYFYPAVQWACSSNVGITGGITNTTFGPSNAAKQQDTLLFLYRFMCYCNYIVDDSFYYSLFSSSDLVNKASFSEYARRAVGWAYTAGVFSDNTLVGSTYCKRKDAAMYLYALYQIYQEIYGLSVVRTENLSYASTAGNAMNTLFSHYGASCQYYQDISKTQFNNSMTNKFSNAKPLDICYLYCFAHGGSNGLALFTGTGNNRILTPAELRAQIDNFKGTFVVFIAGCYSELFIDRGNDERIDYFDADAFIAGLFDDCSESGELAGSARIKVLCSSSKTEESYLTMTYATNYWCLGSGYDYSSNTFGTLYADTLYGNSDGKVSLSELFDYSYNSVLQATIPINQYIHHIVCSNNQDLFVIFR